MTAPVAIVTGGTHGIGAATVGALAAEGYRVVFTGTDRTAGECRAAETPGAVYVAGDVADEAAAARAVDLAAELGGGEVRALVNNAGVSSRYAFRDATTAELERVLRVNFLGACTFTRLALAPLLAARGAIVNVASIYGYVGAEGSSLYTASKAALIGLTRSLALEYGERLRVNAVCPGQIATRMMRRELASPPLLAAVSARIPAGRLGRPEEVADAIAWLLSDRASFVNGVALVVDGGESAGLRAIHAAETE